MYQVWHHGISGINGLFNHTHNGPIPSSDSIPFYSKESAGSGYLAKSAITNPNTFLNTPNNYTTFSNFVYKNLTELPIGTFLLADSNKQNIKEYGFR